VFILRRLIYTVYFILSTGSIAKVKIFKVLSNQEGMQFLLIRYNFTRSAFSA
jgi:hypothetical protein